jgi:hypothetical protein
MDRTRSRGLKLVRQEDIISRSLFHNRRDIPPKEQAREDPTNKYVIRFLPLRSYQTPIIM